MAKEDRINEAIRIIRKFMNGNYYAFGDHADIFELFEIDTTKDNAVIIEKVKNIRKMFHEDLVYSIPEKYQFTYLYICRTLAPLLETKPNKAYSLYLADRKQSIKDYKKKIDSMYVTEEQKHKFYNDSLDELQAKIRKYNTEQEEKRKSEELRPLLKQINDLINHYKSLSNDDKKNIYKVFNLKQESSLEELLTDPNYTVLANLFNVNYSYFENLYGNSQELKTSYNDIKFLYNKCRNEYFVTPESKNRYDLYLRETQEVKIDIDKIMTIIMQCTSRYYNSNSKIDNYFEIFGISVNKTNDLILASNYYQELLITFEKDNTKYIPDFYKEPYEKLRKLFKDFDINVLHNDEGRLHYLNLLENQNYYEEQSKNNREQSKTESNTNNQQDELGEYGNTIRGLIAEYQTYYENSNFINYYELFKLPNDLNCEELKRNNHFKLMKKCLNREYINKISNAKDAISFSDLCSMFESFERITLANDVRKKSYDEKVKMRFSKSTYKFNYEEVRVNEKAKFDQIRNDYNKALERLIQEYGLTKAAGIISTCLQNDSFNEVSHTSLKEYNPKKVIKFLRAEFDRRKEINELVEMSLNALITKKIDILKIATIRTYDKYDIYQVKKAIESYIRNNDSQYFISGDNQNIGRGRVVREVSPSFIKIILGCLRQEELGFLIDDVDNKYDIIKNSKSIEALVDSLLYEHINTKQTRRKGH
ncbi:MAG: hypothetical protein ACI4WW_01605 [Candidatus Coprovivens sp.]